MKFNQSPVLPASWMPVPAVSLPPMNMGPLFVGQPPVARDQRETKELGPITFPWPTCLEDIFNGHHGSAAGHSAVSGYLTCPCAADLKRRGIVRKGDSDRLDFTGKMDARSFGTLIHALLALRVVYGQAAVEGLLIRPNGTPTPDFGPVGAGLGIDDFGRTLTILKVYNEEHPFETEPFTYLSIEGEVATDIGDGKGGSCLRTAIFDGVVRRYDQPAVVWSLEKKTASRSGTGAMDSYMPQFATQCVIWNANPYLVQKYGPMAGVIPDVVVKTLVPKCERHLPRIISRFMQHLSVNWLRLPNEVRYPEVSDPNGVIRATQLLQSCWGKYEPCSYIGLCWENAYGDYEYPEAA